MDCERLAHRRNEERSFLEEVSKPCTGKPAIIVTHMKLGTILVHVDCGFLDTLPEVDIGRGWNELRGRCPDAEDYAPVSHRRSFC